MSFEMGIAELIAMITADIAIIGFFVSLRTGITSNKKDIQTLFKLDEERAKEIQEKQPKEVCEAYHRI